MTQRAYIFVCCSQYAPLFQIHRLVPTWHYIRLARVVQKIHEYMCMVRGHRPQIFLARLPSFYFDLNFPHFLSLSHLTSRSFSFSPTLFLSWTYLTLPWGDRGKKRSRLISPRARDLFINNFWDNHARHSKAFCFENLDPD